MSESVSVQFKHHFPIFPLPETMLLPHSVMPLSISEPRYLQMTDHALDGSGQIAVATYGESRHQAKSSGYTSLRDVVCLGQIVQHEKYNFGYNILVYGLCRATIVDETLPQKDCLYRKAKLVPFGKEHDEEDLEEYRDELLHLLFRPALQRIENHETIMDWVTEPGLSTPALFELIGCTVFNDAELRYELLSEPSCKQRTIRVMTELIRLDKTLSMTDQQSQDRWENGISWN